MVRPALFDSRHNLKSCSGAKRRGSAAYTRCVLKVRHLLCLSSQIGQCAMYKVQQHAPLLRWRNSPARCAQGSAE